jgi:Fe-S cluster assembly iron-binding protein IscA
MSSDFEVSTEIDKLESEYGFEVYVPKTDREYLENAKITRVVVADHTGEAKSRYIFASDEVEDRCGCGTSFAFEKPVPVIDLEKLKLLRLNFKNKNI